MSIIAIGRGFVVKHEIARSCVVWLCGSKKHGYSITVMRAPGGEFVFHLVAFDLCSLYLLAVLDAMSAQEPIPG